MRSALLRFSIAVVAILGWGSEVTLANQRSPVQVPPNRPLEVRQELPAEFPPVAQALHLEAAPVAEFPDENPGEAPQALPLPKRSNTKSQAVSLPSLNFQGNQTASIAASLFVVIGLFLMFAWVGKKNMKPASSRLSKEVVQVLGKSQLSGKQQLELVRVGQKLLLLCVTPHGADTLTEITDPAEVERLLAIIRQDSPGSMSASFQEILTQMGRQPTRGFLEA